MTEQEKREKAVEEMSRDCFISVGCARMLYDADYRKADEVRKETAKEILQTLFNNLKYPQYFQVYIETLAKKFGVEVEK